MILCQNKINIDYHNLTENNNPINLSQLSNQSVKNNIIEFYYPKSYEKMGRQLLISVLDYEELNPFSKVFSSEFENVYNLRKYISIKLSKEDPRFKNNNLIQNLIKNINFVKNFFSTIEKLSLKLEDKSNNILKSLRNKENKKCVEENIVFIKMRSLKESKSKRIKEDLLNHERSSNALSLQKTEEKPKLSLFQNSNKFNINRYKINYNLQDGNYFVKKNFINITNKKKDALSENLKIEHNKLPIVNNQFNNPQILVDDRLISSHIGVNNSFTSRIEVASNLNKDIIQPYNLKIMKRKNQIDSENTLFIKKLPKIKLNKKVLNNKKKKFALKKVNSLCKIKLNKI